MLHSLIAAAGALWVVVIMWDAFEALVRAGTADHENWHSSPYAHS